MTSDDPANTPTPRFQPLDTDTLGALFAALLVPGRSVPVLAADVGMSGTSVKKYRDRWIEDGLLLRLADGGLAVNPEKSNPFGVAGEPVDPALLTPADGSDAGEPQDDVAGQTAESEDAEVAAASLAEESAGGEGGAGAPPTAAADGDDAENGDAGGGGGGGSGDDAQWQLTDDQRPSGPVAVQGAVPPPAAIGLVDPTVIEVQIQMPVTLVAAWNLMKLDGLDLTFNDWVVQTIELHYAKCAGVLVALVTTAGGAGDDGVSTDPVPVP